MFFPRLALLLPRQINTPPHTESKTENNKLPWYSLKDSRQTESTNVSKALFTLDLTWTQPLTPALPAEQVGVRIPFLYICIPLSDCEIGFIDVQKCWQRRLRATGGSHIQVQPQSVLKVGLNELQMCFHALTKTTTVNCINYIRMRQIARERWAEMSISQEVPWW